MTQHGGPAEQASQLLAFYSPEVVRYALVWLDANPGQDVVGMVVPAGDERPAGFVGSTHEEIARGVASRNAVEEFLLTHAPSATDQLPAPADGRQDRLTVFAILGEAVLSAAVPLPGRAG